MNNVNNVFQELADRIKNLTTRVSKLETWEPVDTTHDEDAIHDNVAAEIIAIAEKVVPAADDVFIIEDSAAGDVKKKLKYSNISSGVGDVGARVYRTVNYTLATGAWAAIPFTAERWDTDNFHDNAVNNTRLTIPEDGTYIITGNIRISGGAANSKNVKISMDGTTDIAMTQVEPNNPAGVVTMVVTTIYQLTTGQYVELEAFQNSGANRTVDATGNYTPEFSIQRIA